MSGAVKGKAVWPTHLKPVAWHIDSEMAKMKLGLYNSKNKVADGEVEYRDISIEGPKGIIRTTPDVRNYACWSKGESMKLRLKGSRCHEPFERMKTRLRYPF